MPGPECAAGHDKVAMLHAGDGSWRCPKCSRQIPAGQEAAEPEAPRPLNLEETLWVLRNVPHEPHEYPAEVLEEFERFWQRVDAEPPEDEDVEVIRDGSSNLDKYIYG